MRALTHWDFMTRNRLQMILNKQIPLSKAMKLKVRACAGQGVEFALPLKPNRNHKNTAFGGTMVAAQALACWSWLMLLLEENAIVAEVVLQRQSAEFLRPVHYNFTIKTRSVNKSAQTQFIKTLKRFSKSRIQVESQVMMRGRLVGTYVGEYVAIKV
jgi:thioesterase domain-containing protein